MSDYTFLEECTRYVNNRKQDSIKRYTQFNKAAPVHLTKLAAAAAERTIQLKFLLQNFTKNKLNTTYYDWKSKVISWRVEWHFVNADDAKFVDERCDEQNLIGTMLEQLVTANGGASDGVLRYYQARGIDNVRILLKAEGIRKSRNRYYELDADKSLGDNLRGKTIVEFPVIFVIYSTDADDFDIIDSGELLIIVTYFLCIYANYPNVFLISSRRWRRGNRDAAAWRYLFPKITAKEKVQW